MRRSIRFLAFTGLAIALLLPMGGVGRAAGVFTDVPESHTFFKDITWMHVSAITRGCNPPTNDQFCPNDYVTRGQMAAFLVRALLLPDVTGEDFFLDDESSIFEGEINRLAGAGITRGCNPPTNDQFCPDDYVTRGQMASFLVRALGLTGLRDDAFNDDDHSVHELDINRLYAAGITRGCNPPLGDRFCPDDPVTRAEMSAFLHRALGGGLLGGRVFEDTNLDGVYNGGDWPLAGATVYLEGTVITRRSSTTDFRGAFAFGPLDPDEYMVFIGEEHIPPGALLTTETWNVVDVYETTSRLDLDYGMRTPHGVEQSMVGNWQGSNSNPWTDPYDITIEFRPDGSYLAATDAEYWALYFAPDIESPLKTYQVNWVGSGGTAQGDIEFVWDTNSQRTGAMTAIDITDGDHLTIEIWDRGIYGPVILDLNRVDP